MISVIIPTIDGREHWLEKAERVYCETTENFELIVVRNAPSCNLGWNTGIEQATGDFIHLSADDLEPHPGWWRAALRCVRKGQLPCARVLNSDGTLQSCGNDATEVATGSISDLARVPFFPRTLLSTIYPIFGNHYCGDYWVTARARALGWETVVIRGMVFTHHMAAEGRRHTVQEDYAEFLRLTR